MENDTYCHSVKVQGFIMCTVIERVKQLHLSVEGGPVFNAQDNYQKDKMNVLSLSHNPPCSVSPFF